MVKKLYYIANIRFPTEKAHGIQIAKMCEAFADLGLEVTLVVPKRRTPITQDPFEYYGVRRNFKIQRLFTIDTVKWGRAGFLLQAFSFAKVVSLYALFKNGIFYTRDELPGFYLRLFGKKVIWEAHMGQQNIFARYLIRARVPLVVITQGLEDLYIRLGMPAGNIHVAPDGVDIEQFDIRESKAEARQRLSLPSDEKIVLYTGHLYSWKGADTLALAAKELKTPARVLFLGGTEEDIASFKEKYGSIPNISILGKKPHGEMPLYMRAADVLVIPNSAKEDISKLYTSPMKLFEYMASGTPIVASDLPSLREVINESSAFFSTPDDPHSLAETIGQVFASRELALEKARETSRIVRQYSWNARAKTIVRFFNQGIGGEIPHHHGQ